MKGIPGSRAPTRGPSPVWWSRDAWALHRAQNIRERLGGSANMTKPFPEKPKGMHHETYWRLREEHDEAEMEQLAGMREWLDKLERKVG